MSSGKSLTIATFGAFAVQAPGGEDLTPRSQKACGLLALLCDAPQFSRPRAALQDKLWSDRGQAQGAASLRQTLTEIRKAFGEYRDVLVADTRMVSLDPARVQVDFADPARVSAELRKGAVFLDGIGVRDPEFEDWLRDFRLKLEDAAPDPASGASARSMPKTLRASLVPSAPVLYLAPAAKQGQPIFADHIAHAIAKGVADLGAVDLRGHFEIDLEPPVNAYVLEACEQPLGDGVALRLQLSTLPERRICWQRADVLPVSELNTTGLTLSRLINDGIDRTSAAFAGDRLFGSLRPDDPAVAGTAATIRRMWRSAGRDPGALIQELQESFEREGRGVHLAWEAFVWCFVVGERRDTPKTAPDAQRLIRQAMELEPHNPLVLALASHVYGFVLRQFPVSLDLAERAVKLDSNNILGWAFLGLARLNMKQREEGYVAAARARQMAGEGPHRPFIDALMTAAASLTGRADEAIAMGETSHALRPDFAAPLRYLLASYVSVGDMERARMTALRLRNIEPDFEPWMFVEPEYPVEPIRRSGLIDVRKMPELN